MGYRLLGLWCVVLLFPGSLLAAQAVLKWQAPNKYINGRDLDTFQTPPTYRIYVAPDTATLQAMRDAGTPTYIMPVTRDVYPTVPLSQIGLTPGEWAAVTTVSPTGVESVLSAPFCYQCPEAPLEVYVP